MLNFNAPNRGGGGASAKFNLSVQLDKSFVDFYNAMEPKRLWNATKTAFTRSLRSTVTGARSPALKNAFGPTGRYNISVAKAKKQGEFKGRVISITKRMPETGLVQVLGEIKGKAIGLHHFTTHKRYRKETVLVGKNQYKRKQKVLRIKVLRSDKPGVPRLHYGDQKRWPSKYPQEFGGFFAVGRGDNSLIFRRDKYPMGHRGTDRYPIVSMYTMGFAHMVLNPQTFGGVEAALLKSLPKELESSFNYYLNVAGKQK